MNTTQQEKLCEVLRAQVVHYEDLLVLSKKQSELIGEGKILDLFPVFTKIDSVMKLVQTLETSIVEEKAAWEKGKTELPENQHNTIAAEFDTISNLLKEILALEQDKQDNMAEQQKRNRKDVTKINRGQQMVKAYGQAYKPGPQIDSLLDRRT